MIGIALESLRTLDVWDLSEQGERERAVALLAHTLASRFHFVGWEWHALGDQEHILAVFADDALRFALLPGYEGELGYDPARHTLPQALVAEWEENRNPRDATFADYLGRVLTPLRQVTLPPCLLQMDPEPLWWLHPPDQRGVRRLEWPKRADVLTRISAQGFRFPTSDEWEYACSGGTRALFRWSNDWPPINLTRSKQHGPDEWREDLARNAFGLTIGQDCQQLEYCVEPTIMRGGDSGAASCGDVGPFSEWLGFASSYCYPFSNRQEADWHMPYLRRLFPLSEVLQG
jgi:Sulfatase-modifying factor enzyme 1